LSVTDTKVESARLSISYTNDGIDVKAFTRDTLESLVRRLSGVAVSRRKGRRHELTEAVIGSLVKLEGTVGGFAKGESTRNGVGGSPGRSGNILTVPPIAARCQYSRKGERTKTLGEGANTTGREENG